jgi:hydroxymethylglutaryl-CoA synthase
MTDLVGYGSYVPRYRIQRSDIAAQYDDHARGGETAVPAHDENVTTMAVEAATTALDHADAAGSDLDLVYAATTSDPFDERGVAPHVTRALGAPDGVRVGDFQGSARAATNAVSAAVDAVAAGRAGTALVVASDVLSASPGTSAERTAGAGAGALVLGRGNEPVAELVDEASATTGYVGRFAPADAPVREGDGRFNREQYLAAVTGAVGALDGGEFDRVAFPAHDGGWGQKAAGALDIDAEHSSTFDAVGYAAAGGVLLDLAAALDAAAAGDRVLVAGYGPGGCDAVSVERRTDSTPETTTAMYLDSKEHVPYGKHRQFRDQGGVA